MLWNHGPERTQSLQIRVFSGSMALGDASDVAARRLHISFACAHRWPTDVDRLRCGLRTRLGARKVHTVGSCCTPRPRLPASRDPTRPPALSTMSPHSALELRVLRRCFQCAATRVASCPCHACRRRATPRQARPHTGASDASKPSTSVGVSTCRSLARATYAAAMVRSRQRCALRGRCSCSAGDACRSDGLPTLAAMHEAAHPSTVAQTAPSTSGVHPLAAETEPIPA